MSVSVIIPTYNRAYSLPRAIDSVLAQTQAVDEIIVVDDGSTDETRSLLSNSYPDLTYIYQTRAGVSAARNHGVNLAKGQWIAFLDSDDEWLPHKIEKQMALLTEFPSFRLCHTEEIWIRHGKRVNQMNKHQKSGGWIYEKCLPLCAISPSSVMLQKSLLQEMGGFREDFPACEDYDLWLKICSQYPVLYIEEPCIVKYGGHDDQLSRAYWGMDRFRIQALVEILESSTLSQDNREQTLDMLQQKIEVYLQGAKKRNKVGEVAHYENLLKDYCTS